MSNVSHLTLTGTEVHEPKGVENANLGEVYVADGNGSGNWSNVSTSTFTGLIADFPWPKVQSGWLECDGTDINITTYPALYDVMTIQSAGTRINGNATITSIASTSDMRVGYYVFGTGIAAGTTIAVINSGTQITLSAAVSSSGTSNFTVSPWFLGTGTIRLPAISNAGRYRRSRTSGSKVGDLQDSTLGSHSHSVSATTGTESVDHTHTFGGTTGGMNQGNPHTHGAYIPGYGARNVSLNDTNALVSGAGPQSVVVESANIDHGHAYSGTTSGRNQGHTHSFSAVTTATGSAETRPLSIVLMTCVKY